MYVDEVTKVMLVFVVAPVGTLFLAFYFFLYKAFFELEDDRRNKKCEAARSRAAQSTKTEGEE